MMLRRRLCSRLLALNSQKWNAEYISNFMKTSSRTKIYAHHLSLNRRLKSTDSMSSYTSEVNKLKSTVSATVNAEEDELDKPIKFSTSKAATYRSEEHFFNYNPNEEETYKHQPKIVLGSLFVFLVYFLILREENDVDEKLTAPIFNTKKILRINELEKELKKKYINDEETFKLEEEIKRLKKEMGVL